MHSAIAVAPILVVMFFHWFADFVCQTDWMARNKSKDLWALTSHVLVYMVLMGIPAIIWMVSYVGSPLLWLLTNGVLHWATDYVTSRASSPFFQRGDFHNGFVIVGIDQYVHLLCLVLTTVYFSGT